eukprot:g33456.t1
MDSATRNFVLRDKQHLKPHKYHMEQHPHNLHMEQQRYYDSVSDHFGSCGFRRWDICCSDVCNHDRHDRAKQRCLQQFAFWSRSANENTWDRHQQLKPK